MNRDINGVDAPTTYVVAHAGVPLLTTTLSHRFLALTRRRQPRIFYSNVLALYPRYNNSVTCSGSVQLRKKCP